MIYKILIFIAASLLLQGSVYAQNQSDEKKFSEYYNDEKIIICSYDSRLKMLTVVTRGYGSNPAVIVSDKINKKIQLNNFHYSYHKDKFLVINRYSVAGDVEKVFINDMNMEGCGL